jgi:hypothetical protein
LKYSLLLLTHLAFTFLLAKGQVYIGLQGGAGFNYLQADIADRSATTITSRAGYIIETPVEVRLYDWLYAKALPALVKKNYRIERTGSLSGVYTNYNNTYLQLPVLAHFVWGKRLIMYADVGPYVEYWLSGRVKGNTPDLFAINRSTSASGQTTQAFQLAVYNERYQFNSQRDNRVEWGGAAGMGVEWKIQKKLQFVAGSTVYLSFTDMQKHYMINQKAQRNQTGVIFVGCLYRLK